MKQGLVFLGTRGSAPMPGPDTLHYGGNTSCLAIVPDNPFLPISFIDAGTGISLGQALFHKRKVKACNVFFTHGHLDHICGLPSFLPLYDSSWSINLFYPEDIMENPLETIFNGRTFPLNMENLDACITFTAFAPGARLFSDMRTFPVEHALVGGVAYLFGENGEIFISGDCENPGNNEGIREAVSNAKILIVDGTYSLEEIESRRGWGHSCAEDWLSLRKGSTPLYLTHHDSSDRVLDERAKIMSEQHENVFFAREGQIV